MDLFEKAQKAYSETREEEIKKFYEQYTKQISDLIIKNSSGGIGSVNLHVPEHLSIDTFADTIKKINKKLIIHKERTNNTVTVFGWDGAKKINQIKAPAPGIAPLKTYKKVILGQKTKRHRRHYIPMKKKQQGQAIQDSKKIIDTFLLEKRTVDVIAEKLGCFSILEIEHFIEHNYSNDGNSPFVGNHLQKIVKLGGKEYTVPHPAREYKPELIFFYTDIVKKSYSETGSIVQTIVPFNNHQSFSINQTMMSEFLKKVGMDVSRKKRGEDA